MTKIQFLFALDEKLQGLTRDEIEGCLTFYSEMIDARMEEGLNEEEAVKAVGDVDEIAASIMAELTQPKPMPEKQPKRRMSGMEITLLIIGFPLWFPLLAAAIVVALSLFVSAWSVIISLWSAFGAFAATGIASFILCFVHLFGAHALTGAALFGSALILVGLSVFTFYGCIFVTKYTAILTKKCTLGIIKLFKRREAK